MYIRGRPLEKWWGAGGIFIFHEFFFLSPHGVWIFFFSPMHEYFFWILCLAQIPHHFSYGRPLIIITVSWFAYTYDIPIMSVIWIILNDIFKINHRTQTPPTMMTHSRSSPPRRLYHVVFVRETIGPQSVHTKINLKTFNNSLKRMNLVSVSLQ